MGYFLIKRDILLLFRKAPLLMYAILPLEEGKIIISYRFSEFFDIFEAEHFKKTLQSDVRIVSSLPSTHLNSRPTDENKIPLNLSPLWIRTKLFKLLNEEGVLLLSGLDSKLSKDLPLDLQKLRCKDNELAGVLGGSGGSYITTVVIQVFLNHFVFGMKPLDAILQPTVYHTVFPSPKPSTGPQPP